MNVSIIWNHFFTNFLIFTKFALHVKDIYIYNHGCLAIQLHLEISLLHKKVTRGKEIMLDTHLIFFCVLRMASCLHLHNVTFTRVYGC